MYKCSYVDMHYLCVSHWYQIGSVVFGLIVIALWESIYRKITETAYRKVTWALPFSAPEGIKPSKANARISTGYTFTAAKMPWGIFLKFKLNLEFLSLAFFPSL